jgi:SAM-dependent methyltransferase
MSERAHQQLYQQAIRQARLQGPRAFQAWFNREASHTMEQAIIRGYWDFAAHILTPTVCRYIERPEEKIALEIGYGGGRLLNAAASYFKQVIGIDIHREHAAARAFLRGQGKQNVQLLTTDGQTISAASNSIDCIYSFIVLQHVPTFATFVRYIAETYRCLKPGGVAQLYYGSYARLHPLHQLRHFLRGYREVAGKPANHITLTIRTATARRVCARAGLRVVETGPSYYRTPDGYPARRGGQRYLTLVKDKDKDTRPLEKLF